MGSCAAPSAKGDDKFITTDYLQQCPWLQDHLQSDRDVLVAREVVDILHFHHQPWIMPPPSSPPTPVPGFSGLSGLLGLQPAWARSPADGLTAELRRLSCV
uniref:hypothetical protein n=1 Tax=Klebsiella pneumoniae TaxID=573 RepID=UPI001D0DF9CC|nr:hypothetical protein [Klebsiella pneumoniae]